VPRIGVGFDIDHTLAIDNKLERVAFLHLLEHVVESGGHFVGTLAEESDWVDALLARQRGGACSIDDAVRGFCADHGVAQADAFVERFRAIAIEIAPSFVVALPGAKRTIEALRERGVAVAVLSNGWSPLQQIKARHAGFEGRVIASADLGVQKPHRQAFEALLEALGTRAADSWYVGDDPYADVNGALQAGMHAVWLDAEGKTYPADVPPPSHRVGSLEAVLGLVPAASA